MPKKYYNEYENKSDLIFLNNIQCKNKKKYYFNTELRKWIVNGELIKSKFVYKRTNVTVKVI